MKHVVILALVALSGTAPAMGCVPYDLGPAEFGQFCSNFIAQISDGYVGECPATCMDVLRKYVPSCLFQASDSGTQQFVTMLASTCESLQPTEAPTFSPTFTPTFAPTPVPTAPPSHDPTALPTAVPTQLPTYPPTEHPTTLSPTTDEPSFAPTHTPTELPTERPTATPTVDPTVAPTREPTADPTHDPTFNPTVDPTRAPTTAKPTAVPTDRPTELPTHTPSHDPTQVPTHTPTEVPTTLSPTTDEPSLEPTADPTDGPTSDPTYVPTDFPTQVPTFPPTNLPSAEPTRDPTHDPTELPTADPTRPPTLAPTVVPTEFPTHVPTNVPSSPTCATYSVDQNKTYSLGTMESDVQLVLDASGSISAGDWTRFEEFTSSLIGSLPIGPKAMHLGIIEFNTEARQVSSLVSTKDEALAMSKQLSKVTSGRTYVDKAIYMAMDDLEKNGRRATDPKIPQVIIVLTDGAPSDRNAAAVAFKAAIAKGYQVQIVLIGFMAVFMPPDADWSSAPPMKMMGGYESLLQARAQVTDLVCSVSRKTEAPTALPTLPPSKYPTPSPTMEPTLDPTRTPTHTPTDEPTVSPTHVPTELPTRNPTPVPTEFPTEFPTLLPTKEPSPCRAARLHLIFRDESAPSAVTLAMSRRLLATARLETMKVELLKSTAVALKVTPSVLKITATSQADSTIHVEISFRGLDSLRMGADMETKILNGQFDPLPDYRIRKMWMEEVFDCDLLAAWNTPPYSGSDPEVFTSAPKVTSGAKPVPAPAVIAVSPVVEPEDVASPETTSPIVATPVTLPPREVKKGCISTPPAKLFSKLQLKCAVDWSACAWKTWNIRKCSHIRRCCVRGGGAKCVICGGR